MKQTNSPEINDDRLSRKTGFTIMAVYMVALVIFIAAKATGDSQWIDTPWLAAPFIALFVTALTGWIPVIAVIQLDTVNIYERVIREK